MTYIYGAREQTSHFGKLYVAGRLEWFVLVYISLASSIYVREKWPKLGAHL